MAERDASKVQLDFPQLTADLIAALRLTGTLGVLNLGDTVIPTISVGDVRPPTFSFQPVTYQSSEFFFGNQGNVAANTIVVDTGPLAAGTYDLTCSLGISCSVAAITAPARLEHRNAADAATLATPISLPVSSSLLANSVVLQQIGYVIALNERLRIMTPGLVIVGAVSGTIGLTLRPTP